MESGIYQIRNKVNGKVYIGQAQNIQKRWNYHRSFLSRGIHSNRHLQSAFNKYGIEAFEWSVLEKCPVSELNEREKYWIFEKDAFNFGYNLTLGGEGTRGLIPSESALQKRSASLKKALSTPKYKEYKSAQMMALWKDEGYRQRRSKSLSIAMQKQSYKDAISASSKARWNDPLYKKNYKEKMRAHFDDPEWKAKNDDVHREVAQREERRLKIGVAHKKRFDESPELRKKYAEMSSERWKNALYKASVSQKIKKTHSEKARSILQVETGSVYNCLADVINALGGGSKTTIWNCCIGKHETAFGFHWRYADETAEDWARRYADMRKDLVHARRSGHIPVPVICEETGERFCSCKSAASFAGVDPSSISACCRGKTKTSGGYHWHYAD